MMKAMSIFLFISFFILSACSQKADKSPITEEVKRDSTIVVHEEEKKAELSLNDIKIEKELLYDKYTLDDVYPYKDTTRVFQWDKIRERLLFLESVQQEATSWAILQNYKNRNKEAPLIKKYHRDEYNLVADSFGVARYQSVPLYHLNDSVTPERYGRDGSLVKYIGDNGNFIKVSGVSFDGEWLVPKRYVKQIGDTITYKKAIFVDVTNQNITTLEKVNSTWYIRSMNPATTGQHRPPYQHETPLGLFVIQEQKPKMIYLVDGSTETGGFSPHASRFSNGGYIHGVPVNAPRTSLIEYSQTLGTTPRSHMCVRNATSHAKFIYDWAPVNRSVVFVIN